MKPLSEKEFEIINVIADGFRLNQRTLSQHVGLSLGMTNLLIRRLATKGYLRIRQLDRRKVEYLLTARGLAEKARKTYLYTIKTVESFGLIRSRLQTLIRQQIQPSTQEVIIVGRGDLADFAELVIRDLAQGRFPITRTDDMPAAKTAQKLIVYAGSESLPREASYALHLLPLLATSDARTESAHA